MSNIKVGDVYISEKATVKVTAVDSRFVSGTHLVSFRSEISPAKVDAGDRGNWPIDVFEEYYKKATKLQKLLLGIDDE